MKRDKSTLQRGAWLAQPLWVKVITVAVGLPAVGVLAYSILWNGDTEPHYAVVAILAVAVLQIPFLIMQSTDRL